MPWLVWNHCCAWKRSDKYLYFCIFPWFSNFLKCSQSWQQNQAKYNLDAWALNVIRRIFSSIENIHQLLLGERGLPGSWRDTWNRTLWTWTTHEYLKIVTMSAVTKDGRMSSGSHMIGYFSHTTSFNALMCVSKGDRRKWWLLWIQLL